MTTKTIRADSGQHSWPTGQIYIHQSKYKLYEYNENKYTMKLPLLELKVNSNVALDDCALATVTDSSAPHTGKALTASATIDSLAVVVSGPV